MLIDGSKVIPNSARYSPALGYPGRYSVRMKLDRERGGEFVFGTVLGSDHAELCVGHINGLMPEYSNGESREYQSSAIFPAPVAKSQEKETAVA